MPRKAKRTLSGAPGGPARPPVNTTYGDGERALESQRRMPVADYSRRLQAVPNSGGAPPGSAEIPATQQDPADRLNAIMAMARNMAPPEPLNRPTQRPNEPLTAGLPMGAGPGLEVLAPGDRVVRTLRMLADVTADASFTHLAEMAAQRMR